MFKEVSLPLAFYNRDTWLKIAFFSVSVIMAAFSLYFTDGLVSKLEEREKQQIELYAETIRYVMTSDENADINFFFELVFRHIRKFLFVYYFTCKVLVIFGS